MALRAFGYAGAPIPDGVLRQLLSGLSESMVCVHRLGIPLVASTQVIRSLLIGLPLHQPCFECSIEEGVFARLLFATS
jgi:hypothetical protein